MGKILDKEIGWAFYAPGHSEFFLVPNSKKVGFFFLFFPFLYGKNGKKTFTHFFFLHFPHGKNLPKMVQRVLAEISRSPVHHHIRTTRYTRIRKSVAFVENLLWWKFWKIDPGKPPESAINGNIFSQKITFFGKKFFCMGVEKFFSLLGQTYMRVCQISLYGDYLFYLLRNPSDTRCASMG